MDPVRAIRTRATYPATTHARLLPRSHRIGVDSGPKRWLGRKKGKVTHQCYWLVPVPLVRRPIYGGRMTTSLYFPGPRDGLDEGSLAELALDGCEVDVDVVRPRPWVASAFGPIDVPDDASALIDGLAAYGA